MCRRTRLAREKSDLVFLEQVQDAVVVLLDHAVLAGVHLGNIHLYVFGANAVFCKVVIGVVKVFARLQQGF